jgi:hypothetical protein
MNKNEFFEKIKLREEQKKEYFYRFLIAEGFTETLDEIGNFKTKTPLFYMQVTENKFLVFNIPFYGKIKTATFQSDFWLVTAISEKEFLKHKLLNENLENILLGFDLDNNMDLYDAQLSKNKL